MADFLLGGSLHQRCSGATASHQHHAWGEQMWCSCHHRPQQHASKPAYSSPKPPPPEIRYIRQSTRQCQILKLKTSCFPDLLRTQKYRTFPPLLEKRVSPRWVHICFSVKWIILFIYFCIEFCLLVMPIREPVRYFSWRLDPFDPDSSGWGTGDLTLIWSTYRHCLIFPWPKTLSAYFQQHHTQISFSMESSQAERGGPARAELQVIPHLWESHFSLHQYSYRPVFSLAYISHAGVRVRTCLSDGSLCMYAHFMCIYQAQKAQLSSMHPQSNWVVVVVVTPQ